MVLPWLGLEAETGCAAMKDDMVGLCVVGCEASRMVWRRVVRVCGRRQ